MIYRRAACWTVGKYFPQNAPFNARHINIEKGGESKCRHRGTEIILRGKFVVVASHPSKFSSPEDSFLIGSH